MSRNNDVFFFFFAEWEGRDRWISVSVNLKYTFMAVNMSCQVNTLCNVNFVITGDWLNSCVKCQVG